MKVVAETLGVSRSNLHDRLRHDQLRPGAKPRRRYHKAQDAAVLPLLRGLVDQHLQAKGFIVVTERSCLGITGMARAPAYELTELAMPACDQPEGRKLYRDWRQGHDFPIEKHSANNPEGRNGKNETLSSKRGRTCHQNGDVQPIPVIKTRTGRHQNSDVQPVSGWANVTKMKTSLVTRPHGLNRAPDLSVMAGLDLCPLLANRR